VARIDTLGAAMPGPAAPRAPDREGAVPATLLRALNVQRFLGSGDARTHILKGVNLSIARREYVSIVGASGSGKSSLLYLLGGLDRPDTFDANGAAFDPPSAIFIDDENTHGLSDAHLALVRSEKVGFVFQFHYLLKEFTAQENVALPMFKLGRWTRQQCLRRAGDLLESLGLADKIRRRANRLSGGEQQRVAIARALANEPAVLLADEPTGNLDRKNSELVADIFHNLADSGQTLVMVTHDLTLARRARRMITMEDGTVCGDELLADAP
jgi:lipoprotein-releasing system ATP-binding protein